MSSKVYFTTGEFAQLCNITKETLFHYDKLGLLKPELVKDNGYRYYSDKQFWELDLIHVLQTAGNPLKDIKAYMDSRSEESFLNMLEQNEKRLAAEKRQIEKMQYRLNRAISTTRYAMQEKTTAPAVIFCEAEHLLRTPIEQRELSESETVHYITQHLLFCEEHDLCEEIPIGSMIPREALLDKTVFPAWYYSRINEELNHENYFKKPAGNYLTMIHKGFYDTIGDSYRQLFAYINEKKLIINGAGYEYELISHFSTTNRNQYNIQIFIPVQPDI